MSKNRITPTPVPMVRMSSVKVRDLTPINETDNMTGLDKMTYRTSIYVVNILVFIHVFMAYTLC